MRIPLIFVSCIVLFVAWIWAATNALTEGEVLYRKGILASGAEVTAQRPGGGSISGSTAACVNCHRPSGMGSVEGGTLIPPVTAKYLFSSGGLFAREATDHTERTTPNRPPYTGETLAKAIREGITPDGRPLNYVMPRYPLDNDTMSALISYLASLSSGSVPGVTGDTLHFATIITPDSDPVKRKGMLDVLQHFFAAKNVFYRPIPAPARYTKMMYRVPRKWQLHIWELSGDATGWMEQLRAKLKAEPVFAVLSGMGGANWQPIHQFCQQESIPCFFPNVELPVVAEEDFYNLYFSKGVLLEAQLIAQQLSRGPSPQNARRIVQVFRKDDVGDAAAKAFHAESAAHGITVIDQPLPSSPGQMLIRHSLRKARPRDVLILWLRPDDLKMLPAEPPKATHIFLSAIMGGLDDVPLPGSWRSVAHMAYPFEIPSRRGALLDYPLGWFRIQQIPVVAEETQVDTYIACNIISESLNEVLDNFLRDYLVENVEGMLSTRVIDGYYTRLSLGPGQRFASKGGYIVRFGGADERTLIPEGDWIVP